MMLLNVCRILIILMAGHPYGGTNAVLQQNSGEEAVKTVIGQLFEGMRKGDSTMVKDVFAPGAVLQTIATLPGQTPQVRTEALQRFLEVVGKPHTDVWDEQITYGHITIDGPLASVWTPYRFYLGQQFSHCGVNSFQLVLLEGKWKIVYLVDTRRKACE